MKILFSDRALSDLEEIGVFIEKNAPEAARRHLQKLIERIRQLEQFPTSGRVVPEYQKENLRELVENNYRIVYEIDADRKSIAVVTIFESHREFNR